MELKDIKLAVFKQMLANQIGKIVVSYNGYGDSGGIEGIATFSEAGDEHSDSDFRLRNLPKINLDSQWIHNFKDEIEYFSDAVINAAGYDGYENEDGGNGTIEIDAMNQKVTIQHNWMEMVSNPEEEVSV